MEDSFVLERFTLCVILYPSHLLLNSPYVQSLSV
ncbi:hypothetical protein FIV46_00260 [Emcibacter nanhaiensis]|uniref:RNA-binding domain-containing protein n=1 Tax=Emcibacter nanhaiensis TaxID=1505037 RepID=A0A501PVP3_9PROT|nr:hypothetical protein FIV46_00260 [Emcibacter nanhaiensis]